MSYEKLDIQTFRPGYQNLALKFKRQKITLEFPQRIELTCKCCFSSSYEAITQLELQQMAVSYV